MRDQDFRLHVKVVGWLHVLEATLYVGGALMMITFFSGIGLLAEDPKAFRILTLIGLCGSAFLLILGVPVAFAGWGLLTRKAWSRVLAMVLAILGLFLFPIGTIIGIYVLWVLTSEPAAGYFRDVDHTGSALISPSE